MAVVLFNIVDPKTFKDDINVELFNVVVPNIFKLPPTFKADDIVDCSM